MALAPAKLAVAEFRLSEGAFPASRSTAGFSNVQTAFVTSVDMSGTNLIVDFNESAIGAAVNVQITLSPQFSGNAVVWQCDYTGDADGEQYVPSSCR
jgi:hypothetical protein